MKMGIRIFVALFSLLMAAANSHAQSYPNRPIRLIVPFSPGGTVDSLARLLGQQMGTKLEQQVVVDTRPGASGTIGTQLAARAAPDGYTLLMTSLTPLVITPSSFSGKPPYDPEKDLAPVSLVTHLPLVIVTHTSAPIGSVTELIAKAKANSGKTTYGSSGSGGINHLAGELFNSAAGIDMLHVPFKGAGPAVLALISKQIDVAIAAPLSAIPPIRSGQLKGLAVSSARRSPALPQVPTISESAIPGFTVTGWYCVMAPGGTPDSIVEQVRKAMVEAMAMPLVAERLLQEGAMPEPGTPDELRKLIRAELPKWAKAVKISGARLD